MAEGNATRIALLGKIASGKSSLANTLFGEKLFKVGGSANSETQFCKSETRTVHGRNIQLIDTPGSSDRDNNDVKGELLRCITKSAPGPHAFLLLLRLEKFTQQEEEVVNLIVNEYFGEEALKYTTLVFTHGDDLAEGMKIEEWVTENAALKNLLEKCQNRCCVFDNKYWNKNEDEYRNNQNQIKKLLYIIDQTVSGNGGRCYTNEMLQEVQQRIEERKRQLRRPSPNISHDEPKEALLKNLLAKAIFIATGAVVGGVLFGPVGAVAGAAVMAGVGALVSLLYSGKGWKKLR